MTNITPTGVLIRTLRQNRKLRLKDMAAHLGISSVELFEIECGNAELTDAQAVLIADMACGIDKAEREKIERRRLTAFLGIGGYD